MNPIEPLSLGTLTSSVGMGSLAPASAEALGQRGQAFQALMQHAEPGVADAPLELDIEKVLMANLPPAHASPAEFAMGMLRAQVRVAQAALAIEMVNKTTHSLSQGIQSLATRS